MPINRARPTHLLRLPNAIARESALGRIRQPPVDTLRQRPVLPPRQPIRAGRPLSMGIASPRRPAIAKGPTTAERRPRTTPPGLRHPPPARRTRPIRQPALRPAAMLRQRVATLRHRPARPGRRATARARTGIRRANELLAQCQRLCPRSDRLRPGVDWVHARHTGYSPAAATPYQSPASPYSYPASDPDDPPPYRPGSTSDYTTQQRPLATMAAGASSSRYPSAQPAGAGSSVTPADYSQPVGVLR